MATLKAEELLAGTGLQHQVTVPVDLLNDRHEGEPPQVLLRPLTIRDLQKIRKAARDDENLSATLMIQHALVEPELGMEQVSRLSAGLAQFLIDEINAISGIHTSRQALQEQVREPLAKTCFILAKEFGWTPEEVSGMTLGQVLLYMQMAEGGANS